MGATTAAGPPGGGGAGAALAAGAPALVAGAPDDGASSAAVAAAGGGNASADAGDSAAAGTEAAAASQPLAPPDAGRPPNSTAPDAGQSASSTTPDAGTPDAGTPDAGTPDDRQSGDAAALQQSRTCDFDALYDSEIDSVVTIRTFDERGDVGQGSGWVYDRDGSTALVVTNWHVVTNAGGADVQFARGEWRSAGELLGSDPYSDLAVFRVADVPNYVDALPVASEPPDEGDPVAALGAPLGLDGSITTGVVSARDRAVTVGRDSTLYTVANAVQVDAAINPGNSGGPLLSCDGEVVGVNFAGVSPTTGENVNFAVAASTVRDVVPALVADGSFDHPYLGVRARTLTPTLAQVNDLPEDTGGVIVESVVPGGPAAGELRGSPLSERVTGFPLGGDVVVAVDGTEVTDVAALRDYLFDETRPGETVTLTVLRNGEEVEVEVELGAKPQPPERPGTEGTTL